MFPRMEKEAHRPTYRGDNECKVFLGGLGVRWSEEELGQFMSAYGRVLSVSIARKNTGESKGYGFVTFRTPQEAAGSLGSVLIGGRCVEVKPSINQQNDQSGQSHKTGRPPAKDRKPQFHNGTKPQTEPSINSPLQKPSSKLSKHSVLFESQLSSSKKQAPDEGHPANSLEAAQASHSSSSSSSSQKTTDHSGGVEGKSRPVKPLDRQGGISKLSKEYHPIVPLDPRTTLPVGYNPMVPVGFGFMGPSYVSCGAGGSGLEYDSRVPLLTHEMGLARSAPDLRIKFFTFPGRD